MPVGPVEMGLARDLDLFPEPLEATLGRLDVSDGPLPEAAISLRVGDIAGGVDLDRALGVPGSWWRSPGCARDEVA